MTSRTTTLHRRVPINNTCNSSMILPSRLPSAPGTRSASQTNYDTAHHDATQARTHQQHVQQQHDTAVAAAQRARDSLKQLKQQLRELESRGNDSLAVYGNNMAELCQRVKQAVARGEFSAPPRGPIGSYLKVKDKKWGGVLEHIIGGSLTSFCVNSPEDSRKLFEIMGQVYGRAGKPAVTSSKFLPRAHDVRRHKVRAAGFTCALDALDAPDPVIANYLIDNVGLESVLLVPSHEDAVRLSDTVENVPENCARVVTLECGEYYPAPNYRCYGGTARPTRYLQVSTAERKRQVQSEIQEAESRLKALEAKAEELNQELREARENERAASRTLQALVGERHEKDEAARTAAAALEQQQAPHHAVLLDELNISKEKLRTISEKLASHSQQSQALRRRIDELDAGARRAKNRLADVSAACRSMSEEIEQEQLKQAQGASERQACQQKLKEDQHKLAQVASVLEEKTAHIEKLTAEALTLCERVQNPRDRAIVTNELKKTQLKLSSIRSDGLTKAQVAERLLEVERKYRRTKQTLARLKGLIDEIQNTTDKHLNFCHRVQTYIARRVQYCFQSILTLRGYSGSMEIDNARGALEIVCTGREQAGKRHASSTSSLSGGERSYSTVAFIMALWECVELPFYFMDEFDVFMDNVNRKIVMELLIDHALKNTSRQFVFLTPQDASAVVAGPQISIHLMADPRP
ncbi:structural maintenance of chromosomes protein 6-like [Ostrinia furnacalis]|uniref:structural maintenance of chromosomes protein 6-like n=1 Tax=Ostrinia furnacalis TaxID=93504 RepID=UPI00103CA512|nr:structural maintenance of chromosomes protein 6-like [Ostrinia furnacalis]